MTDIEETLRQAIQDTHLTNEMIIKNFDVERYLGQYDIQLKHADGRLRITWPPGSMFADRVGQTIEYDSKQKRFYGPNGWSGDIISVMAVQWFTDYESAAGQLARDATEWRKTADNTKVGEGKPKQKPMKDLILELVLAEDITLFTDQHGRAYCRIPRGGHYEILAIDRSDFSDWLGWLLYNHDGHACSDKTLDPARRVLRAKAKFEGEVRRLENRTAWASDGALHYDLTDEDWRAVRITAEGWEIDPTPPILFRRYAHQAAQVTPERVRLEDAPEILTSMFKFVNLRGKANRLIFTVHQVSQYIPGIAHPILIITGEQGCGKTFALKISRRLVDPSEVSTLALPWKGNDSVQQLAHHWCSFYDNLTNLTDGQQDILCRAVTGEGYTKRALYTNEEDIIFTYRRCIALNGINIVTTRPDLLDRSIIFELDPLGGSRRTEAELEADFKKLRPRLLGAILEVLVGALDTDADRAAALAIHFRLADWVACGFRIAEALGKRGDEFVNAYAKAVKSKSLVALELHPLGRAAIVFMSDRKEWTGTAKELLERLGKVAEAEGVDTDSNLWPGSPSWVGRRLKEIKPDLRTAGVTYTSRHGGM